MIMMTKDDERYAEKLEIYSETKSEHDFCLKLASP